MSGRWENDDEDLERPLMQSRTGVARDASTSGEDEDLDEDEVEDQDHDDADGDDSEGGDDDSDDGDADESEDDDDDGDVEAQGHDDETNGEDDDSDDGEADGSEDDHGGADDSHDDEDDDGVDDGAGDNGPIADLIDDGFQLSFTDADFADALDKANAATSDGSQFVSVQLGSDTVVFLNGDDDPGFDQAIILVGGSFANSTMVDLG